MSSASGSARKSIPTQLVIHAQTFTMFSYSILQMLRKLTNKTDDEPSTAGRTSTATKSWTMTPSRLNAINYSSIYLTFKSILSWMVTDAFVLNGSWCTLLSYHLCTCHCIRVINATALWALWNTKPSRKSTHRCVRCVRAAPACGAWNTKPAVHVVEASDSTC